MKFYVSALFSALAMFSQQVQGASVFTMNIQDKMSMDFLTGFESGIFLRNNTKQFDEYGCPKAKADMAEIQMLK
jgi:hypothetical protein